MLAKTLTRGDEDESKTAKENVRNIFFPRPES